MSVLIVHIIPYGLYRQYLRVRHANVNGLPGNVTGIVAYPRQA